MGCSTKNKSEWDLAEDTKVERKNYKNLVTKPNNSLSFTIVGSSDLSIVDSGTTGNYIITNTPCVNKTKANHPIPITLPNGDIISSTRIVLLAQKNLPDASRRAHIFPHLTRPLISIGNISENNCITVFDTNQVTIYDKDTHQTVMTGQRDPVTTLYIINMTETPTLIMAPPFLTSSFPIMFMKPKLNKTS